MKKNLLSFKNLAALHVLLFIYSMSGILSKLASNESFFSLKFCLYYAGVIGLLGIYAIVWQQIIKKMPLTSAYANKSITVVWGILWGFLIFNESITVYKIIGAMLIIAGIVLYSLADGGKKDE